MIFTIKRDYAYKIFHFKRFRKKELGQNQYLTKNVPVFWALFGNSKKSCHVY